MNEIVKGRGESRVTSSSCKVCSHRKCDTISLYVVFDPIRDLTKIGISRRVNVRVSQHRQQKKAPIELLHEQVGGCDYTASIREERALSLLPQDRRTQGDWFAVEPATAIMAVQAVCDEAAA